MQLIQSFICDKNISPTDPTATKLVLNMENSYIIQQRISVHIFVW